MANETILENITQNITETITENVEEVIEQVTNSGDPWYAWAWKGPIWLVDQLAKVPSKWLAWITFVLLIWILLWFFVFRKK